MIDIIMIIKNHKNDFQKKLIDCLNKFTKYHVPQINAIPSVWFPHNFQNVLILK